MNRRANTLMTRIFVFGVLCFVVLFAGSCANRKKQSGPTSGDWPTWRGNSARTAIINDALPATLKPLWTRQLARPAPAWPASQHKIRFDESYVPVTAGKRLFVASMTTDSVAAYNTDDGMELWRFYCDGPVRFAPLVWNDKIYVVSDDGRLYCLNASNGRQRWTRRGVTSERMVLGNDRLVSAWPVRGAPVLNEEGDGSATLYFAAGIWPFMGIFIHAIDAETGAERWVNSGSGSMYVVQQHDSPAFAGVAPQGYLAVKGDILLVSGGRTVPAAYDRHTGDFMYFKVASRAFGKDAGGFAVGAAGEEYYYNHGCLYDIKDGSPVLNLSKMLGGDHLELIGNGFAVLSDKGIECYKAELESESQVKIDRKGSETTTIDY
ncbi:MAG: hypothetical protein EOM10_03590, partial [Opitutae bacterium]|nr:hypothetical protein [Opitutae bacterium]